MIDVKNLSKVTVFINNIARDINFCLCYTAHCKDQMTKRGITTLDIMYILKTGRVDQYQGKGEHPTDKNIHRYKMVGTCVSRDTGREIGVVLLVSVDSHSIPAIKIKEIVTAMWQD